MGLMRRVTRPYRRYRHNARYRRASETIATLAVILFALSIVALAYVAL